LITKNVLLRLPTKYITTLQPIIFFLLHESIKCFRFSFSHEVNLSEEKIVEEQEVGEDATAGPVDDPVQDGDDGVDPLMFIQVGQVESNYADFDKDGEAEENQVFFLLFTF
jgi:hypothetical protein